MYSAKMEIVFHREPLPYLSENLMSLHIKNWKRMRLCKFPKH